MSKVITLQMTGSRRGLRGVRYVARSSRGDDRVVLRGVRMTTSLATRSSDARMQSRELSTARISPGSHGLACRSASGRRHRERAPSHALRSQLARVRNERSRGSSVRRCGRSPPSVDTATRDNRAGPSGATSVTLDLSCRIASRRWTRLRMASQREQANGLSFIDRLASHARSAAGTGSGASAIVVVVRFAVGASGQASSSVTQWTTAERREHGIGIDRVREPGHWPHKAQQTALP